MGSNLLCAISGLLDMVRQHHQWVSMSTIQYVFTQWDSERIARDWKTLRNARQLPDQRIIKFIKYIFNTQKVRTCEVKDFVDCYGNLPKDLLKQAVHAMDA